MIRTSRQLKALVRNLTKGDSIQAQIIIRNYVMERFLERISLSKYRNNFILKGGMLVSAMVGLDTRSTMDIDTTIKNMPLSIETAKEMIEEIIAIPIDDGMTFFIKSVGEIMDEAEYRFIVWAFPKMARIKVDRYRPTSRITPIIAKTLFTFFIVFLDSFYFGWSAGDIIFIPIFIL